MNIDAAIKGYVEGSKLLRSAQDVFGLRRYAVEYFANN
jgi:hypothetical protein